MHRVGSQTTSRHIKKRNHLHLPLVYICICLSTGVEHIHGVHFITVPDFCFYFAETNDHVTVGACLFGFKHEGRILETRPHFLVLGLLKHFLQTVCLKPPSQVDSGTVSELRMVVFTLFR